MLDALEANAPGFAGISLMQGTKYFGSYLGPFKTPAKESDPRIPGGEFYYAEEDLVTARQRGKRWTWTAVRPTAAVCGFERAPGWAQGSFSPPNSRLACEYDFISDTLKLRQSGFTEVIDSEQMFLLMFMQFRNEKVIS